MFYSSCGSSNQSSHRSDHCAFSSAVFDQLWNHSADYLKENKIVSIHLTFYPSREGILIKKEKKEKKKSSQFQFIIVHVLALDFPRNLFFVQFYKIVTDKKNNGILYCLCAAPYLLLRGLLL